MLRSGVIAKKMGNDRLSWKRQADPCDRSLPARQLPGCCSCVNHRTGRYTAVAARGAGTARLNGRRSHAAVTLPAAKVEPKRKGRGNSASTFTEAMLNVGEEIIADHVLCWSVC